ncbi:hypothetical protein LTR56_025668 [Elasticomyces elasticus]|nr:hypothetical protein LTR56_025668 [Elasticomyces elasticus]KAK5731796.1 hypothetical protein LTS12_027215 [Elasticomyces elasticus]
MNETKLIENNDCVSEAANKNDFDPTAGSWRRFSKTRVVQLALQIGNNLLGRGYDHIWQGINPDIAFDPAEFFTATDAVPGNVSNLSYDAARTLLGFSSKATDRADVISVPSRSTVPAALSASSAPHFANSGFGDFESEFSMNPVPDPLWPCTLNQAVSDSAVLPNNDLPWWGGFSAEFHLNTVSDPSCLCTGTEVMPGSVLPWENVDTQQQSTQQQLTDINVAV